MKLDCENMKISTLVFIFLKLICLSESAKILGIFPSVGYSQYIGGSSLMKGLAAKGHEVTMISPFSQKVAVKNFKEIVITYENNPHDGQNLYDLDAVNILINYIGFYDILGSYVTERTLNDTQVQELLHSDATFDLVIVEIFINEAHFGFAHHFNAPLVVFCSMGAVEWANHLVGNPAPFSHIPMLYSPYSDHMSFSERLYNTYYGLLDVLYKHLFIFPKQNRFLQKYFPNPPLLHEVMYNASLVLLNSNVAMNVPIAHVPNMIEIGGFHVSPKKLPKDFQDFLDSAHDGAIFFSMGSNLKTSELSEEKTNAILKVFSKLKQKVLWKWEKTDLPGKPKNVKIAKWMPQQDILAHPNIRAFITHGGLLSLTEAVYNGVPIIVIPVFGDQQMNAQTAVLNGFAIKLPLREINEQKFSWALNEILTNTSYRETAQKRSRILHDQPLKPLDTGIFWIEYVLRHQGAPHLRSAALNLNWYQYFLLDVIGFVIIVVVSFLLLLKIVCARICKRSKIKQKTQ